MTPEGTSGGAYNSVVIGESLPPTALSGVAKFIETYYLTPSLRYFTPESFHREESGDGKSVIFSWALDLSKIPEPSIADPPTVSVKLTLSPEGSTVAFSDYDRGATRIDQICGRVADDIEAVIVACITNAKRTSLHFVFSVGKVEKMEAPSQAGGSYRREVIKKIFAGNTTNLLLILVLLSFVFILFLGNNALIAILAVQVLALVFSDKFVMGAGVVRPTKDHPEVTVVTIMSTPEGIRSLSKQRKQVMEQMKGLFEGTSPESVESPETKLALYRILLQTGLGVSLDDIQVRTRNPYELVKTASQKFNLPMPKIAVVNNPVDNAAASGISQRRSSMTITAGALEDLSDGELLSVIGHELGHIRGRDPLILFSVVAIMYIGGLYVWYPLLEYLGLFYLLLVFVVMYVVGKFLETRADTASVVVLGKPDLLASALTQIGFRQLYYEKYSPRALIFDWLRFDPHPPIYFRVKRLAKIASGTEDTKHLMLLSVRDVISGFLDALVGKS